MKEQISETWKDIKTHLGSYQVSNLGRVKSLNHYNGKFKKYSNIEKIRQNQVNNKGYYYVLLYNNKKIKSCYIHRLVAETFISNPENKLFINHKDGNKLNNNINNLEWVTKSENELHAHKIGLKNFKKNNLFNNKININQVNEIREKYNSGNYYQKELAKEYNVTRQNISCIVRNKSWNY